MCNQLLDGLVFTNEPDLDLNTLSEELIDLGPDIGQQLGEQSPTRDVPDLSEAECQYIEKLIELNIDHLLQSKGISKEDIQRLKPFFCTFRDIKKQECSTGQSSDTDSSDTEDSTETEDENIKELIRYNENLKKQNYSEIKLQGFESNQLRTKEHTIRKLNIEEILGPEASDIKELLQSEESVQESKIFENKKEKYKKDIESNVELLRSDSPDIDEFLGTKDESIMELLEFKEDLTQELREFDVQKHESEKVDNNELLSSKCSNIENILESDIDNLLHCKEEFSMATRKPRSHKVKALGQYINDLVNAFLKLKIDPPRNLHNSQKDTENVISSQKDDSIKNISECVELDRVHDFDEQSNVKQVGNNTEIESHGEKINMRKIFGSRIKNRLHSKHEFIKDILESNVNGRIDDQVGFRPDSPKGTDIENLVKSNIENLMELKVELNKMRSECRSDQTNTEKVETFNSEIVKLVENRSRNVHAKCTHRNTYSNLKDKPNCKTQQSNNLSAQKSTKSEEFTDIESPRVLEHLKFNGNEHTGGKNHITEVSDLNRPLFKLTTRTFYEKFLEIKEVTKATNDKMPEPVKGQKLKRVHIQNPHIFESRTERSTILERRAQKYKTQDQKISLQTELLNMNSQNKEEALQKQEPKVITREEFINSETSTWVDKIRETAKQKLSMLCNGRYTKKYETETNTPKLTKIKDMHEPDLDVPASKKPRLEKSGTKQKEIRNDETVSLNNKLNFSPLVVVSVKGTFAKSPVRNIKNDSIKVSDKDSSDKVISRNNKHLNLKSSQYTQKILELNDSETNINNNKTFSRTDVSDIENIFNTKNNIEPRQEAETGNSNGLQVQKSPVIGNYMQPNIDNLLMFKNQNKDMMPNGQRDNTYNNNIVLYEASNSPGKENIIAENLIKPAMKLDVKFNNENKSVSTDVITNTTKASDLKGSNGKLTAKMFYGKFSELIPETETTKPKIVEAKNDQKLQKTNILKFKMQNQVQKPNTKTIEIKTHEIKDKKLELHNKLLTLEPIATIHQRDLKHESQLPGTLGTETQESVQQEYKIPLPKLNIIAHNETKIKTHTLNKDKILKSGNFKALDFKELKIIDKPKGNEVEANDCKEIWNNIKTYKEKQMKTGVTKTNNSNNNTAVSNVNSELDTKTYYENFLLLKEDLIKDNLKKCEQHSVTKEYIEGHLSDKNTKDHLMTKSPNLEIKWKSDKKSIQEESVKLITHVSQENNVKEVNVNELNSKDFQLLLHSNIANIKRLPELKTEKFKNVEKFQGNLSDKLKSSENEQRTTCKPKTKFHKSPIFLRQECGIRTENQVVKSEDAEVFRKPLATAVKRRTPIKQVRKTIPPKKQNKKNGDKTLTARVKCKKKTPKSKKAKLEIRHKKECKTESTDSSSDSDESGNTDSSDDESTSSNGSNGSSSSNDSSSSGSDTSSDSSSSEDSNSSDESESKGDSSNTEDEDTTSKTHPKHQLSCEFCDRLFNSKENLKEHRRMHSRKGHSCHVCKKSFVYKCELTVHLKEHPSEFVCCICGQDFHTKILLRDHVDFSHPGKPKCMFCGMRLNK